MWRKSECVVANLCWLQTLSSEAVAGATYFAEIDQNLSYGTAGRFIPSLLCSGEIFAFRKNAMLTGKERFAVLGLLDPPFDSSKLTDEQQMHLAGCEH